jgi:hypothetical protein
VPLRNQLDSPSGESPPLCRRVCPASRWAGRPLSASLAPRLVEDRLERPIAVLLDRQLHRQQRVSLAAAHLQASVRAVGEFMLSTEWWRVHALRVAENASCPRVLVIARSATVDQARQRAANPCAARNARRRFGANLQSCADPAAMRQTTGHIRLLSSWPAPQLWASRKVHP